MPWQLNSVGVIAKLDFFLGVHWGGEQLQVHVDASTLLPGGLSDLLGAHGVLPAGADDPDEPLVDLGH